MNGSSDKKVHCAVYSALYQPWLDIIINGQEKTWISVDLPKNFTKILNFEKDGTIIYEIYKKKK